MLAQLTPLKHTRLRDDFVSKFVDLILSGQLAVGAKLPPERALASQLGVSRPVVHDGLVELAARGLVTQKPRVGTVINDYRREGSLAALNSLIGYARGQLAPPLIQDLLAMRRLLEMETTRRAAQLGDVEELAKLTELLEQERALDGHDLDAVADLDFAFHHQIAMCSGNAVFSMLLKSCEPAYKNLSRRFFAAPAARQHVLDEHIRLSQALQAGDADASMAIMAALLNHGAKLLEQMLQHQARD